MLMLDVATKNIDEFVMKNSNGASWRIITIGIKIDTKHSFEYLVSSISKKTNQKWNAFVRIVTYLYHNKRKC